MSTRSLHRFTQGDKHFAIDPENCFCFECDGISCDVLEHYPDASANRIVHLLRDKYEAAEIEEVISELDWLLATKSIMQTKNIEALKTAFELEKGIRRVTVCLDETDDVSRLIGDALHLLLSRSGEQDRLWLELRWRAGAGINIETLTRSGAEAQKAARLAGKTITLVLHQRIDTGQSGKRANAAFAGHEVGLRVEILKSAVIPQFLQLFSNSGPIDKFPKRLAREFEGIPVTLTVQPGHADFVDAVKFAVETGFQSILLDLPGAWTRQTHLVPADMAKSLQTVAKFYAEELVRQNYFTLEPIADLFHRIYEGKPIERADPAGSNELAIDANGNIYPAPLFVGQNEFLLGSVEKGIFDETARKLFDDLGTATTRPCRDCWARHLCGGGHAAIHHALSGSFREPHTPWCDAQRDWLESAVAGFSLLASAGVNFTRIHATIGQEPKRSLFRMANALFRTDLGIRPIEEADAQWLATWENWNEAAYFVFNESSMMMSTRYDRETDSLHPRDYENELIILGKNRAPAGLLKVRPERFSQAARVWIYLHRTTDYADHALQKAFQSLLADLGARQSIRRITVPVGPKEADLGTFLQRVGFIREGVEREALYLHGQYHDVCIFGRTLS